jgi:hypothetical protein
VKVAGPNALDLLAVTASGAAEEHSPMRTPRATDGPLYDDELLPATA